jgi:4-hydroxy-4-methyl-2-oxoglutarate aldolase
MSMMQNMMKKIIIILIALTVQGIAIQAVAQEVQETPVLATHEQIYYFTSDWDGERLPDGRPYVSDEWLERLKNIKVEDVWQLLNELGYRNQFEGNWKTLHDDKPMAGRALTAQYMPLRPNIQEKMFQEGIEAGHIGAMNSWPIDQLQKGDIYVADNFGKIAQGTLIGDKLGNSIFSRSQNGVIFDGSLRDAETLATIEGFNAFSRGWHPSFLEQVMLMGINVPVRIGGVTVFPGDVILAKQIGVVFIPPHLVEQVVVTAEIVALRDEFVHERVRAGVYTPGQVDARWTQAIEEDFLNWVQQADRIARMPVPVEQMQEYLQQRTW